MRYVLACLLGLAMVSPVFAQDELSAEAAATTASTTVISTEYMIGRVLEVQASGTHYDEFTQQDLPYQTVKVVLPDKTIQIIEYGDVVGLQSEQLVKSGERVIVSRQQSAERVRYDIIDHYRLPWLWLVVGIFAAVVIACTRWRGMGALISVGISLVVLVQFLVPQLLNTDHPLLITLGTLVGLAVISFYLGHGISAKTQIALVCTIAALGIAVAAASFTTWILHLSGTGSEAALSLKYSFGQTVELRGILMAGLLIGALGVLDDVTTAQVQAVHELKESKPELTWGPLFAKAFRIGQAHIVSLVNTLVLAYAGAALPAFLVLSNYSAQPLWIALNSETLMEEMIQMIVGSFTLVIAVPLTTAVAAWWMTRNIPKH